MKSHFFHELHIRSLKLFVQKCQLAQSFNQASQGNTFFFKILKNISPTRSAWNYTQLLRKMLIFGFWSHLVAKSERCETTTIVIFARISQMQNFQSSLYPLWERRRMLTFWLRLNVRLYKALWWRNMRLICMLPKFKKSTVKCIQTDRF